MCLWVTVLAQKPQVSLALNAFNEDSLIGYVKALTGIVPFNQTDTIKTRLAGTSGNEHSFQYIKQRLISFNLKIDSQQFSLTGKNLLGIKEGRSKKFMILGAHYDAVGVSSSFYSYPGADDNASGTSAVIEAARVLSQYDWPFTIKFAFWDEEEQGLLGSNAYCRPDDAEDCMGYVNLDMIAWDGNNDSSFEIHTNSILNSNALAQKAINVLSEYNIPLKPTIMNPGDQASDHKSFWINAMTAIAINEEYIGADFNPNWHRFSDSLTKFNLHYFTHMTKLGIALIGDCAIDTVHLLPVQELMNYRVNVNYYPNPADDIVWIELSQIPSYPVYAQIIDKKGSVLEQIELSPGKNGVSLSQIEPGIYFLSVVVGNASGQYYKILKM